LMFPTVEGMRMNDSWKQRPDETLVEYRVRRAAERAATCDRCGWFPAQLRSFDRVLCGRCWDDWRNRA